MAWITVATDAGQNLIGQYSMGGHTLTLTGAAVASGIVDSDELREQTALTDQEDTASIVKAKAIEGGMQYKVQVGPHDTTAYTAHQIGIWARLDNGSNTLLVIAQDDDDGINIPNKATSPNYVFSLYIALAIDNTENLTVNIDGSAYVSGSTLDEAVEDRMPLDLTELDALQSALANGNMFPVKAGSDTYYVTWQAIIAKIVESLGGDPIPVSHGGTGGNTPAKAKKELGLGPEAMNMQMAAPSTAEQEWILSANVVNEISRRNTHRISLVPMEDGLLLWDSTTNENIWRMKLPLPVGSGGTGGGTPEEARRSLGAAAHLDIVAASGMELFGDVAAGATDHRTVRIGKTLSNNRYMVLTEAYTGNIVVGVQAKTTTTFDIYIRNVTDGVATGSISWAVILLPSV